jgi:hypothetical protein
MLPWHTELRIIHRLADRVPATQLNCRQQTKKDKNHDEPR